MPKDIPVTLKTININGKEYLSTSQFAAACGRGAKTINHLILYGNKIRKLESILQFGSRLVPIEELTNFPFTGRGRYGWRNQHSASGVSKGSIPGIDEVAK